MIKINDLTKVYKDEVRGYVEAISHINLTLPSKGLVFIVGKSGSGKSTLLNMIGTLDNITSGEIDVDGFSYSKFRAKKFQQFRSSYLGFIFQDFLLLDDLTVYENVDLALNISNKHDPEKIKDILKRVELEDMESRYPTELSGGQKQRVAIARTLVKDPKILLCDEPTGNLDVQTTKAVLNILKEESKTKLVLIVSHNMEDAERYGDRIIELQDGKVLSDVTKRSDYENTFEIAEDKISLPHHHDLTKANLDQINELTKKKKGQIIQKDNGFSDTATVDDELNEFKLESNHISVKNSHALSMMFNRKGKSFTIFTILITTILISLMFLFQSFLMFNPLSGLAEKEITSVIKSNVKPQKNSYRVSTKYDITEEEVKKFYENGYTGKIYDIYNYTFYTDGNGSDINYNLVIEQSQLFKYNCITLTKGVMKVDYDYLVEQFGKDGKLDLIFPKNSSYTSIDDCKGLIMPDYIVDCYYNNLSIDPITEKQSDQIFYMFRDKRVCAIINTGYKEKYRDIILKSNEAKRNKADKDKFFDQIFATKEGNEFINEVINKYAYCFITNDNIYENVIDKKKKAAFSKDFYVESPFTNELKYISNFEFGAYEGMHPTENRYLKDNEVVLSPNTYGSLFNAYVSGDAESGFKPFEFKLKRYNLNNMDQLADEITLKCVGVGLKNAFSSDAIKMLNRFNYNVQGLVFSDPTQDEAIRTTANELGLCPLCYDSYAYPLINSIILGFGGFIKLIAIVLLVFSIIYIIGYGVNMIKQSLYEIGVLKALGCKNFDISIIFFIKTLFTGLIISLLSILGIILFTRIGNNILIKSFEDFAMVKFNNVNIIYNNVKLAAFDVVLTLIVILISSFIPLFYLSKIKPIVILRDKKK